MRSIKKLIATNPIHAHDTPTTSTVTMATTLTPLTRKRRASVEIFGYKSLLIVTTIKTWHLLYVKWHKGLSWARALILASVGVAVWLFSVFLFTPESAWMMAMVIGCAISVQ